MESIRCNTPSRTIFLNPKSSSGGIVVNENMNMIEEQLSNGLNGHGITMSDNTLAMLVHSKKNNSLTLDSLIASAILP